MDTLSAFSHTDALQMYTRSRARGRGGHPPGHQEGRGPPQADQSTTRGTGTGDRGRRPDQTHKPHKGNESPAGGEKPPARTRRSDLMAVKRPPLTALERRAATPPRLGGRLSVRVCHEVVGVLHERGVVVPDCTAAAATAPAHAARAARGVPWSVLLNGDQPKVCRPTNVHVVVG